MSSHPNPWRRRAVAFLWILLALTAVVQVGRLAVHVVDPSSDWFLSTRHPFWAQHECLPAYVFAAELHERGEGNVYHARHYPGLNPEAEPTTRMDGGRASPRPVSSGRGFPRFGYGQVSKALVSWIGWKGVVCGFL